MIAFLFAWFAVAYLVGAVVTLVIVHEVFDEHWVVESIAVLLFWWFAWGIWAVLLAAEQSRGKP